MFAYDRAYTKDEAPLVFRVDLVPDGEPETVKVFIEKEEVQGSIQSYTRSKPVIIQILGKEKGCLIEVFNSDKDLQLEERNGNELGSAQAIADFWGDGRIVFVFMPISTGYGSGYQAFINFLVYRDGQFKIITGPELTELDDFIFFLKIQHQERLYW